jgi:PTS system mannose-specific IIB component
MYWVRIDNRLVHGQIIETWLPFTGARLLVVANDELAGDEMQQEIMALAIPHSVEVAFVHVPQVDEFLRHRNRTYAARDILVLFANCKDVLRAYEEGLALDSLNVGNLHYSPGKKQVCAHVALSSEDVSCLRFFSKKGVELDFRCVPNDSIQVKTF